MKAPRVTLDQWRTLQAVVDHGGFAQAAEALHRSQSSVSYTVARMQEQLGVPLLRIDGRKAVLTDQDRRYVYVVGEDNTTARRAVKTGRDLDHLVVVREGLEPGDRVIVNGTQKVFMPGMPVQPNPVSLDEPAGGDLAGQP